MRKRLLSAAVRAKALATPYQSRNLRLIVASRAEAWIETRIMRTLAAQFHVASRAEAWIETGNRDRQREIRSVASRAEAWIETYWNAKLKRLVHVASRAEAWIETSHILVLEGGECCRLPRGGVD